MYGIPKILQTREDFDFCLAEAKMGNASPREILQHFRGLITSSQCYVFDKALSDSEAPAGEPPHFCVSEQKDESTGVVTRAQYRLDIDTSSRIFSLGYTVSAVTEIITELEGLL